MRALVTLDYYYPHWTGLSAYAKRLAEGLVKRGHSATVLTSLHNPDLARQEEIEGVRVIRLPVLARFSRGVIMPTFPITIARLIADHDIVHIHTPMPEVAFATGIARALNKPSLVTHQGDIVMPKGLANSIIQQGVVVMSAGLSLASQVVVHSADYGAHSAFLAPFASKLSAIFPPVDLPQPQRSQVAEWRAELGLTDKTVIGFAGRFVEEKGFDILLRAIPELLKRNPNAHLVYAGEVNVVYERFFEHCQSLIEAYKDHITIVGLLRDPQKLANFYAMCDVFALPSRTDCFPSVQIEAMLAGTPVVTSDIPGAREAVQATGMGLLVPAEDPEVLAAGIVEVAANAERYRQQWVTAASVFDQERSVSAYEDLMLAMISKRANVVNQLVRKG